MCGAICCAGAMCCNCMCKGLSACGVTGKAFPKVGYLIQSTALMLIATILMYTFRPLFRDQDMLECNEASGGGYECFGTAAVLRASFILFLYHILILILIIPRTQCSSAIHDGFFTLKFIVLFGSFIASFWISNDFFKGWSEFCRVGSIIYLFIQSYFLLNFAYLWNEKLVQAAINGEACYAKFLLCGFSILLATINAVWFAF